MVRREGKVDSEDSQRGKLEVVKSLKIGREHLGVGH